MVILINVIIKRKIRREKKTWLQSVTWKARIPGF
jgi:hypothetical protein